MLLITTQKKLITATDIIRDKTVGPVRCGVELDVGGAVRCGVLYRGTADVFGKCQ